MLKSFTPLLLPEEVAVKKERETMLVAGIADISCLPVPNSHERNYANVDNALGFSRIIIPQNSG